MEKKCSMCHQIKLIHEFYVVKRGKINNKYGGRDFWPSSRCRKCSAIYRAEWYKKNPEIKRKIDYDYHRKLRLIALNHYSNGNLSCSCCGEREVDFLCLDHINNDGAEERKTMGDGIQFIRNLIRNNFKSKLQILCFNCNAGKQKFSGCPHKRKNKV